MGIRHYQAGLFAKRDSGERRDDPPGMAEHSRKRRRDGRHPKAIWRNLAALCVAFLVAWIGAPPGVSPLGGREPPGGRCGGPQPGAIGSKKAPSRLGEHSLRA
jgi:hypothetical protein